MTDNKDLKKQIQQLEALIDDCKRESSRPKLNYSYRYNPVMHYRSRARSPVMAQRPYRRPSRNMKLVVKREDEQNIVDGSAADSISTTTPQYVSCGNKLVRVDSSSSSNNNKVSFSSSSIISPKRRKIILQGQRREVVIDGEAFMLKKGGHKLVRCSKRPLTSSHNTFPRKPMVSIDGIDYLRTKRGSLVRADALRRRKPPATTTTTYRRQPRNKIRRKALCTDFLYGKCEYSAEDCKRSHELLPETVPICTYYQGGRCFKSEDECNFIHVKANPNAPICRRFVYSGYCSKGKQCPHRHVRACPDWVEKGKCTRQPKCLLPHPAKRAVEKSKDDLANLSSSESDPGSESEDSDESDESDDDMVSDDEAEELLKWYDDNYVE